ncbi:hypothetical protein MASR2M78_23960 [Treponema sp.]
MNSQTRIRLSLFCEYAKVEYNLAREFAEYGLYPFTYSEQDIEIETRYIYKLKKIIEMHRTLGINKEGIKVILELGEQICDLQKELAQLQKEMEILKLYEGMKKPENLKLQGLFIEIEDPITIL